VDLAWEATVKMENRVQIPAFKTGSMAKQKLNCKMLTRNLD